MQSYRQQVYMEGDEKAFARNARHQLVDSKISELAF